MSRIVNHQLKTLCNTRYYNSMRTTSISLNTNYSSVARSNLLNQLRESYGLSILLPTLFTAILIAVINSI